MHAERAGGLRDVPGEMLHDRLDIIPLESGQRGQGGRDVAAPPFAFTNPRFHLQTDRLSRPKLCDETEHSTYERRSPPIIPTRDRRKTETFSSCRRSRLSDENTQLRHHVALSLSWARVFVFPRS